MGQAAGAAAGGFALHDGIGFEAGAGTLDFLGVDAAAEAVEFADEAVESRLARSLLVPA